MIEQSYYDKIPEFFKDWEYMENQNVVGQVFIKKEDLSVRNRNFTKR